MSPIRTVHGPNNESNLVYNIIRLHKARNDKVQSVIEKEQQRYVNAMSREQNDLRRHQFSSKVEQVWVHTSGMDIRAHAHGEKRASGSSVIRDYIGSQRYLKQLTTNAKNERQMIDAWYHTPTERERHLRNSVSSDLRFTNPDVMDGRVILKNVDKIKAEMEKDRLSQTAVSSPRRGSIRRTSNARETTEDSGDNSSPTTVRSPGTTSGFSTPVSPTRPNPSWVITKAKLCPNTSLALKRNDSTHANRQNIDTPSNGPSHVTSILQTNNVNRKHTIKSLDSMFNGQTERGVSNDSIEKCMRRKDNATRNISSLTRVRKDSKRSRTQIKSHKSRRRSTFILDEESMMYCMLDRKLTTERGRWWREGDDVSRAVPQMTEPCPLRLARSLDSYFDTTADTGNSNSTPTVTSFHALSNVTTVDNSTPKTDTSTPETETPCRPSSANTEKPTVIENLRTFSGTENKTTRICSPGNDDSNNPVTANTDRERSGSNVSSLSTNADGNHLSLQHSDNNGDKSAHKFPSIRGEVCKRMDKDIISTDEIINKVAESNNGISSICERNIPTTRVSYAEVVTPVQVIATGGNVCNTPNQLTPDLCAKGKCCTPNTHTSMCTCEEMFGLKPCEIAEWSQKVLSQAIVTGHHLSHDRHKRSSVCMADLPGYNSMRNCTDRFSNSSDFDRRSSLRSGERSTKSSRLYAHVDLNSETSQDTIRIKRPNGESTNTVEQSIGRKPSVSYDEALLDAIERDAKESLRKRNSVILPKSNKSRKTSETHSKTKVKSKEQPHPPRVKATSSFPQRKSLTQKDHTLHPHPSLYHPPSEHRRLSKRSNSTILSANSLRKIEGPSDILSRMGKPKTNISERLVFAELSLDAEGKSVQKRIDYSDMTTEKKIEVIQKYLDGTSFAKSNENVRRNLNELLHYYKIQQKGQKAGSLLTLNPRKAMTRNIQLEGEKQLLELICTSNTTIKTVTSNAQLSLHTKYLRIPLDLAEDMELMCMAQNLDIDPPIEEYNGCKIGQLPMGRLQ